MSWEDAVNSDSDGVNDSAFVNSWNSDKMSDSDEEDATAKELARERAEKQKLAVVANTKHKKTFEEIQAEREAGAADRAARAAHEQDGQPQE